MSIQTTDTSQSRTELSDHPTATGSGPVRTEFTNAPPWRNILLFLIAFRILNALSIRTFFQPDEYFQSLEPAWQMVFGEDSGAWITWEWRHQLRSSIHPAVIAAVYYITSTLADLLDVSPRFRADLLIAAPKMMQAFFAALGDYHTARLAERIYGRGSSMALIALGLSVCSPWQWLCSTRTLSNSLETTLTIVALDLWPWQWSSNVERVIRIESKGPGSAGDQFEGEEEEEEIPSELFKLRRCLSLAALACVLRPTNLLIWIMRVLPLSSSLLARKRGSLLLFREAVLCGSFVLVLSASVDRLYYGIWTFPPAHFLYFNIAQSLAIFYGQNDWHYYLSQGLPLLLTTALPFTLCGIWQALRHTPSMYEKFEDESRNITMITKSQLATTILVVITILSLVSHKEVRFIYPLLPTLHILAAEPISLYFFTPNTFSRSHRGAGFASPRTVLLALMLVVNIFLAYYTTFVHQTGVLNVLHYLRHESENPQQDTLLDIGGTNEMTVGFLMPCHSTPWRSHLIHPTIHAWALSCEPPVNLNPAEKEVYVDEADRFYNDPASFLRTSFASPPAINMTPSLEALRTPESGVVEEARNINSYRGNREWPDYLVFFEQLKPVMQDLLLGSDYREQARLFNSDFHDDWRRTGDVVVWSLKHNSSGLVDNVNRWGRVMTSNKEKAVD
ncbi:MAG: glycosylphosphatidylinositol anchor biosynthesis [Pycnora praestabilis]|nr:MAG: glycosylphosphatidylinositol anchor biosynthesis [Pycnora praestabilis]